MSCPRPGEKCVEFACGSSIDGMCTEKLINGSKRTMCSTWNDMAVTLKCRTYDFVEETSLKITAEEYEKLLAKHGTGFKTQRVQKTSVITKMPDEELSYYNRVDTDGFIKAVAVFKKWLELLEKSIFENKKFRAEIIFDSEGMKTDFNIYTNDNSKEC